MQKKAMFCRNLAIKAGAAVVGGYVAAELSIYVTDSESVKSLCTIAGQYVSAGATFFPLHASDNNDLYRNHKNEFQWRIYGNDMKRLVAGVAVLSAAYAAVKYFADYKLQEYGYGPGSASLLCDAVGIPIYIGLVTRTAARIGLFREPDSPLAKNADVL